jgi:hypothetical protein
MLANLRLTCRSELVRVGTVSAIVVYSVRIGPPQLEVVRSGVYWGLTAAGPLPSLTNGLFQPRSFACAKPDATVVNCEVMRDARCFAG